MNDRARTWPALEIGPTSDLLLAALTDFDTTAIEEQQDDRWRVFFATAQARDRAAAALRTDFPEATLTSVDVPDENWAARSQAGLRAIRAGRIVVAPPWDRPAASSPGELVIVIQPSMGFGTGHHATTRLCLEAMQHLDVRGRRVIDAGTGSGVLAIAASLLGAATVVGFDDDADAIQSAGENLDLNPGARVALDVGDLRGVALPAADLVVANLTGGLLISEAPRLQRLVAPRGWLVLSGLLEHEEHEVTAAFAPRRVHSRSREDDWLCLTLGE